MKSQVMTITPQIAKEWLQRNMVNRRISESRVNQYATDMRLNSWQLNYEAIKFSKNGKLIDGQHRLMACAKANVPFVTYVLFGIEDGITLFDRGRNRSEADILTIEGIGKELASKNIVAVAKLHYVVQRSYSGSVPIEFIRYFLKKYESELLDLYQIFKGKSSTDGGKLKVFNACVFLACFYGYLSGVNIATLERFISVIRTGFYDSSKHETAAIIIRNDIIQEQVKIRGGSSERIDACHSIEKALYDFAHNADRQKSYKNCKSAIYSNNIALKEEYLKFK